MFILLGPSQRDGLDPSTRGSSRRTGVESDACDCLVSGFFSTTCARRVDWLYCVRATTCVGGRGTCRNSRPRVKSSFGDFGRRALIRFRDNKPTACVRSRREQENRRTFRAVRLERDQARRRHPYSPIHVQKARSKDYGYYGVAGSSSSSSSSQPLLCNISINSCV